MPCKYIPNITQIPVKIKKKMIILVSTNHLAKILNKKIIYFPPDVKSESEILIEQSEKLFQSILLKY